MLFFSEMKRAWSREWSEASLSLAPVDCKDAFCFLNKQKWKLWQCKWYIYQLQQNWLQKQVTLLQGIRVWPFEVYNYTLQAAHLIQSDKFWQEILSKISSCYAIAICGIFLQMPFFLFIEYFKIENSCPDFGTLQQPLLGF